MNFYILGPVSGTRCASLADPLDVTWENNYICVPNDSPYYFSWSNEGNIDGLECIKTKENKRLCAWQQCKCGKIGL